MSVIVWLFVGFCVTFVMLSQGFDMTQILIGSCVVGVVLGLIVGWFAMLERIKQVVRANNSNATFEEDAEAARIEMMQQPAQPQATVGKEVAKTAAKVAASGAAGYAIGRKWF